MSILLGLVKWSESTGGWSELSHSSLGKLFFLGIIPRRCETFTSLEVWQWHSWCDMIGCSCESWTCSNEDDEVRQCAKIEMSSVVKKKPATTTASGNGDLWHWIIGFITRTGQLNWVKFWTAGIFSIQMCRVSWKFGLKPILAIRSHPEICGFYHITFCFTKRKLTCPLRISSFHHSRDYFDRARSSKDTHLMLKTQQFIISIVLKIPAPSTGSDICIYIYVYIYIYICTYIYI